MKQRSPLPRLYTIIIALALLLGISYMALSAGIEDRFRRLAGIGGAPHAWGTFRTANGNAWLLDFAAAPTWSGYTWAYIYSTYTGGTIINTLTWFFWIENIGWVGGGDMSGVSITPDPSGNPRANWTLSGHLWSDSAGWIDMNNVLFVPDNTYFSGFAWNDGIGWIDLWWATLAQTSSGFIWKVKILWNAGWASIFNTVYDVGQKYSSANINKILNVVKKNITLLKRNAGTGQINTVWTPSIQVFRDTVIYENTGGTISLVRYSDTTFRNLGLDSVRSIIVLWANVYIDESVLTPIGDTRPRTIIVLPNDNWIGGNIFIDGSVTKIQSSLVAGGSIFSAYFPPATQTDYIYYNTDASSTAGLPDRQLYVFGSIISHNSLGGSTPQGGSTYVCPYIEVNCTRQTAIRYDFNYFRDYQKNPAKRGYIDSRFDDWSLVIEYNPLLVRDPPPGLTQ